MKNNLEKLVKGCFKRKFSMSLAALTLFAITGSVGYGYPYYWPVLVGVDVPEKGIKFKMAEYMPYNTYTQKSSFVRKDSFIGRNSYVFNDSFVFGDSLVDGSSYIRKDQEVTENQWVRGHQWVGKSLTVKGHSILEKKLTVKGKATVEKNLDVLGDSFVGKNSIVGQHLTVVGNSKVGGNSIVEENLTVKKDSTIKGDFIVEKNSDVLGDSFVGGNHVVDQDSIVFGNSTVVGNSTVEGKLLVGGLNVKENIEKNTKEIAAESKRRALADTQLAYEIGTNRGNINKLEKEVEARREADERQDKAIAANSSAIKHLDRKVNKGTAMTVAMSNVDFQNVNTGEVAIGAGIGHYVGDQAVAVGIAYGVNEDLKVHAKWSGVAGDPHYNAIGGGVTYKFKTR